MATIRALYFKNSPFAPLLCQKQTLILKYLYPGGGIMYSHVLFSSSDFNSVKIAFWKPSQCADFRASPGGGVGSCVDVRSVPGIVVSFVVLSFSIGVYRSGCFN